MQWNFKDDFWFSVTFFYRGPASDSVYLVGDFNGWKSRDESYRMQVSDDGEGYCLTIPLSEGFYHYKFFVDGVMIRDHHNPHIGGQFGNSIMFVHMDPNVYGLRNQFPPFREYKRPYGNGSEFQVLNPILPPEIASYGTLQRLIFVYLPPSYFTNTDKHYPVVYAHDGQNLFSTPAEQGAPAWGGWYLDAKLDHWWTEGELPEFILVAIPNSDFICIGNRQLEYSAKDFRVLNEEPYVRYLIEVVKPHVDENYRTLPTETHTLGSSLGGLISFLLPLCLPNIFKSGICLSPALWYVDNENQSCFTFLKQMKTKSNIKLYIDSGDGEADNKELVRDMNLALAENGWKEGIEYVYVFDECRERVPLGVTHSEAVWRERVKNGLIFVLNSS